MESNYPRQRHGLSDEELRELLEIAKHDCESLVPLGFIFLAAICLIGLWVGVSGAVLTYAVGLMYSIGFSGTMTQMAGYLGHWTGQKRFRMRVAICLLAPLGIGWFFIRAVKRGLS